MLLQVCAVVALFLIGRALLNTTEHPLPNVPDYIRAISPLFPAEFVHSKADLDQLFGAPGSAIRRAVLVRDASHPADVLAIWGFFSLGSAISMVAIRPKLRNLGIALIVTSAVFLFLRDQVLDLTVDAANSAVFTDETAQNIYRFAQFQWSLMFVNTLFGSLLFLGSAPEVQSAAYLSIASAMLGIVGLAFNDALIPYAALGIILAVAGLAMFCGFKPEMV